MKTLVLATVSAAAMLAAGGAFASTAAPPATYSSTGNLNLDTAPQSAYTSQLGSGETSTTTQNGTQDRSVVLQGWTNHGSGADAAQNNTSTVTQSGNSDAAAVMQANYNGTNGNTAIVAQSGSGYSAFEYQFGDQNKATITQSGSTGASNTGAAALKGNDNYTVGEGIATGLHSGAATSSQVSTLGARIVQDEANGDTASITQGFDTSGATISQHFSTNSTSTITQNGYGGSNQASSYQQGDKNYSTITQGAYELATVEQVGNRNYSNVYQSGYGNEAHFYQTGNDNTSNVNQYGGLGGNGRALADVYQSGNMNNSTVTQWGGSNQAYVSQYGSAASEVYQNLNGNSGGNNTAIVNQGGVNTFTIAASRVGR